MSNDCPRAELSEEETKKIQIWALRIVNTKGRPVAVAIMSRLMADNMKLLKEVNGFRNRLGYDELPAYEPKGL